MRVVHLSMTPRDGHEALHTTPSTLQNASPCLRSSSGGGSLQGAQQRGALASFSEK